MPLYLLRGIIKDGDKNDLSSLDNEVYFLLKIINDPIKIKQICEDHNYDHTTLDAYFDVCHFLPPTEEDYIKWVIIEKVISTGFVEKEIYFKELTNPNGKENYIAYSWGFLERTQHLLFPAFLPEILDFPDDKTALLWFKLQYGEK